LRECFEESAVEIVLWTDCGVENMMCVVRAVVLTRPSPCTSFPMFGMSVDDPLAVSLRGHGVLSHREAPMFSNPQGVCTRNLAAINIHRRP